MEFGESGVTIFEKFRDGYFLTINDFESSSLDTKSRRHFLRRFIMQSSNTVVAKKSPNSCYYLYVESIMY
jgi:hypothetical protein